MRYSKLLQELFIIHFGIVQVCYEFSPAHCPLYPPTGGPAPSTSKLIFRVGINLIGVLHLFSTRYVHYWPTPLNYSVPYLVHTKFTRFTMELISHKVYNVIVDKFTQ